MQLKKIKSGGALFLQVEINANTLDIAMDVNGLKIEIVYLLRCAILCTKMVGRIKVFK